MLRHTRIPFALAFTAKQRLPFVVGLPCVPPAGPAADIELSDLSWRNLLDAFPSKVHAPVKEGDTPLFKLIGPGIRTVGLLPVRTVLERQTSTAKWVPFVIDTGSHKTFFTEATIKKLKLDVAAHIEIFSCRVNFWRSSGHFDDINLLGTDFLQHCELRVDYPMNEVSLRVKRHTLYSKFIVTDGGSTFSVKPECPYVMDLKKAIKAERAPRLDHIAADEIIIKTVDGAVMEAKDELHANNDPRKADYVFEVPSVKGS